MLGWRPALAFVTLVHGVATDAWIKLRRVAEIPVIIVLRGSQAAAQRAHHYDGEYQDSIHNVLGR